jgi:ubiquinone/menaquinone biosynthesis C-methylase UbiE
MPNYGEKDYWDVRYGEDDAPFDWLFDFIELKAIIEYLLPDRGEELLLIGCGNAPFSPDLASLGGYTNIWNTDISPIVIRQQKEKYPDQRWEVMDVLEMPIPNASVPVIVDKSLVDTLLCCILWKR